MKTIFLLLSSLPAFGQSLLSVTPATNGLWSGSEATFEFTIINPVVSSQSNWLNGYYFAFRDAAEGLGGQPAQATMPGNSCAFAVNVWWPSGEILASIGPDNGGNWGDSWGSVYISASGNTPQYVSNSRCTIFAYTGGSSAGTTAEGYLRLRIRVGFATASFTGPKQLWFGVRTPSNGGPFWSGPGDNLARFVVTSGTPAGAGFGPVQPSILPGGAGPTDDFVDPAGQVKALLVNLTRGGSTWYVGDSYLVTITGPPNTAITCPRWKNGVYQDTLSGFSTDSTGVWSYGPATVQSSEVGDVWEYWAVGNATPIAVHLIVQ